MNVLQTPLPTLDDPRVVVPAPGAGPGNWAGAASAVLVDGVTYLAYRLRRPLVQGRGLATAVARSIDGVTFELVCEVYRNEFGAESFERPVVLRRPDGGWRLYLSCATPGFKHWWIEALDADGPQDLPTGRRTVVLPGDSRVAVKDPVISVRDGLWEMWLCEHPLTEPGEEDRMSTSYLTSNDGLSWTRHGTVLEPRPGSWDARGARVTTVLSHDPLVVLYDGRARAEDNWHEATSVARADSTGLLHADPDAPVLRSADSDGALRYASAVVHPDGSTRFYFELARPDGAHDLVTTLSRS
ncbi:MAG TPA: hypothetical protein VFD59_00195 [Nocardioidaceae bacterium]|nr:hypothetical protein [Nocardioidaceae bacterium]